MTETTIQQTLSELKQSDKAIVLYDGDCLFCRNYVRLVNLREAVGEVLVENIRDHKKLAAELNEKGYDLDEGMIFVWQNEIHHGDDAIHHMALLSSDSDLFNKMNACIFSRPKLSKALYPFLRAGRNAYLSLSGHKKIKDSL